MTDRRPPAPARRHLSRRIPFLRRASSRPPSRRTLPARFRALYGESPAHLAVLLASFAVCGYALARLLERNWFEVAKWVVLAAVVHDLVLVPLYAGADWLLHKALRVPRPAPAGPAAAPPTPDRPEATRSEEPRAAPEHAEPPAPGRESGRPDPRLAAVQHIRVPAFLSLLLLLVYWPLITNDPRNYELDTALTPGVFMGRWLLITAALFGGSALLYGARGLRARRARAGRRAGRP